MSDVVRTFTVISEALAFNPCEYDQFNEEIQREIEAQEKLAPDIALQLAQLKLEANRRFYRQAHD